MATKTVEQEVLDLEREFWEALKDGDIEKATRLTDEPCILTGAQGVGRVGRQALAAMMRNATYTLQSFDLEQPDVRVVSDDVAIVAYRVHEKLTVDGKPVSLDAADASTWVRRNGRWVCALHTEAIAGDPYGRDRQPHA